MIATVPVMPSVRLLWIEPPMSMKGWEVEVDQRFLDEGTIEPAPGSFPGPAGTFRLLSAEACFTLEPHDPAPTFLHESYESRLETWMNSLPDAAEEVAIIARVRDAVGQLAESTIAGDPKAFSTKTVTTTEPTNNGIAVVGRCLILQPAAPYTRNP